MGSSYQGDNADGERNELTGRPDGMDAGDLVPRDRELDAEDEPDDAGSRPDMPGKTQEYITARVVILVNGNGMAG